MAVRTPNRENETPYNATLRLHMLAVVFVIGVAYVLWQFWVLQVVELQAFQELADAQRLGPQRIEAERGIIYARNGEVLVDNRPSTEAVFVPGECPPALQEEVCGRLAELLNVSRDRLLQSVRQVAREPFTQLTVKREISKLERARLEELRFALPGVHLVVKPRRYYPYGSTAAQILGYLGEINAAELEVLKERGYWMGDTIGRAGVERYYESVLRGKEGYMLITRYATGRPQIRTDVWGVPYIAARDSLGHVLQLEGIPQYPTPGASLRLTLDVSLQQFCENLLRGKSGAIVVLDADSGEVLAMASAPTYDPMAFVLRQRSAERAALLQGEGDNPMLCRPYQENFPPGSVFKVLLAIAALEEGEITENTRFFCPGHFQINNVGRKWHCWRRTGHGSVNVVEALAYSCDVFFYNVGLRLGVDRIAEWCSKLGLGVPTGIDLPNEVKGLIPTREWKAEIFKDKPVWERRWTAGDTVNLSIGQGSASTTPLQNAVLMASVVNGGRRVRPYVCADRGSEVSEPLFSERTLAIVQRGMRLCVEDGPPAPSGTGHEAYVPDAFVIGKTGSAQIVSLDFHEKYEREEDIPLELRDHAWFVAGVLDKTPRIAMCILVEHGHHGSSAAAPLAKEIVNFIYHREATPGNVPVQVAQQKE